MTIKNAKIMLIDDDKHILRSLSTLLRMRGFRAPVMVNETSELIAKIAEEQPDVILLDLHLPKISGEVLLSTIKRDYPEIIVIIITGDDHIEMAVKCTQLGAYDYFVKPIHQDRLVNILKNCLENKKLKEELFSIQKHLLSDGEPKNKAFTPILTKSKKMIRLFQYIEAIALSTRPVLILGETGTGKELFAKAIHDASDKTGDFIAANIAGFDDTTLSDSLFGHKRGAFTGAQTDRKGLVNKAQLGSLFLDEIGDLNPQSQIKILRLLQENKYYPLGSDCQENSSARIITATHQDLDVLVSENGFRRDLLFRLQVHKIEIPPLRERREDIPMLTEHFLKKICLEFNRPVPVIPSELYRIFDKNQFLGNIRELEILIYDAVIHTKGDELEIDTIPKYIKKSHINDNADNACNINDAADPYDHNLSAKKLPTIKTMTENLINEALNRTAHNHKKASEILGISRQALHKRLIRREQNQER